MAWFLYQATLAPAGHRGACQASYPATASLTRAGMLVGPGDRRPGHADQRLTVRAAGLGQADGRPRRVHPPRTWPCGWALHQRRPRPVAFVRHLGGRRDEPRTARPTGQDADRIVASSPYQMISVLDWGRRLGVSPIRRAAADRNVMAAGTDRRQGDGRTTGGCRPRPAGGRTIRGRRAARRRFTLGARCRPRCCTATWFTPAAAMTSRSRQPGRSPMSRRSMTASALKANQRQRWVLTCRKGSDWSLQLSVAAREPEHELALGSQVSPAAIATCGRRLCGTTCRPNWQRNWSGTRRWTAATSRSLLTEVPWFCGAASAPFGTCDRRRTRPGASAA